MECEKVLLLLDEYVNNELDEKTNNEIKAHLDNCIECQKELEELLSLKSVLKDYSRESEAEFCKKMKEIFQDIRVEINDDKKWYNLKLLFCVICVAISAIIIMNNIKESEAENDNIKTTTFILVQE